MSLYGSTAKDTYKSTHKGTYKDTYKDMYQDMYKDMYQEHMSLRERELFIGTQCSDLYTSVDTPAKGRVGACVLTGATERDACIILPI